MSLSKGPAVRHYGTVNLVQVKIVFNTIIEDAEQGRTHVQKFIDEYPNGVPVNKLDSIVKRFFDLVLKLKGGKESIVDDATDQFEEDDQDECSYTDADADTGPDAEDYIDKENRGEGEGEGEGDGDSEIVPSSQNSPN